ncbi:site-specific tyrosine recombinase XerD [Firmicutes bacterium AF36-3BH]|nr:site-specific tyrosine recombinase XerD [Firmicutes bacterium AF36-3BH]
MNTYVKEYTSFMTDIRHKSLNTVESYKRDVTQYISYLDGTGVTDISSTTKTTVLSYLLYLQKEGRASSTVSRTLASLRSYYLFMMQNGVVKSNPTSNLEAPHVEKKIPKILSGEEVELLLEQPKNCDNKGIRDKAMLELLYATGIRVSELINLDVSDVNVPMSFIRCNGGKKERIIPMGHQAKDALENYINNVRKYMVRDENETALFVNCSGARLSRQGFWKLIKYYQHIAGIETDITPHTLRHSFAAHLLENGADLHSIQEMMGHADISSTQVYSRMINSKIKDVYAKAHPRA